MGLRAWIVKQLVGWLNHESRPSDVPPCDFARLVTEVQPCDVILVEGRTRVSRIIRTITASPWTHSAFYLGRPSEIQSPELRAVLARHYQGDAETQLVVEPLLGHGIVVRPLSIYEGDHLRICRPNHLSRSDEQQVLAAAIQHLGGEYDFRQMLDLARFLLPFGILPRRWRSTLFEYKAGIQTKALCSTMIAEVFSAVHYPVLPVVYRDEQGALRLRKRNTRLYTPGDFDYSPYFEIIKYPVLGIDDVELYRHLPWDKDGVICHSDTECYLPQQAPDGYIQPTPTQAEHKHST